MADLRILAVDDSPTMRRIIVNSLKRAGFADVQEATDGLDALAKLHSGTYDIVITDWNMPEMDGLGLVTNMRSKARTKSIPVLMITTRSVKDDIVEAMKAGANSYIVKPFSPATLKEKIEQVLSE